MRGTSIWCDDTANPSRGCDGCELWSPSSTRCYAGNLTELRAKQKVPPKGYPVSFDRVTLFPGQLARAAKAVDLAGTPREGKPWLNGARRLIFVGDMGDVFSARVSFEYLEAEMIEAVASPMGARHSWLLLTKRPGRLAAFAEYLRRVGVSWPANLWAGTSVTTERTCARLNQLLSAPGPSTFFVSVEPQISPVSLDPWLDRLSWVIQGGESGALTGSEPSRARPFDLAWARALRDECSARQVAYFLKQLGSNPTHGGARIKGQGRHGKEWETWEADLRVRQLPPAAFPVGDTYGKTERQERPAAGSGHERRARSGG